MMHSNEQVGTIIKDTPYLEHSSSGEVYPSFFHETGIEFPSRKYQLLVKHAFDVVVSLSGILLCSPVLAITAFLIKLTSPGPVIFRHKRAGLNGKIFTVYKFRTMIANAESLPSQTTTNGVFVVKDGNDDRVTPVGAFLRKSSLDELPQLFNVLKGEMSLVGPRPLSLFEHKMAFRWQGKRLQMRPGMTCIWQVSGRNTIMDERRIQMDLDYIDEWSLWLDLKLLLRTIPVVFSGKGAK